MATDSRHLNQLFPPQNSSPKNNNGLCKSEGNVALIRIQSYLGNCHGIRHSCHRAEPIIGVLSIESHGVVCSDAPLHFLPGRKQEDQNHSSRWGPNISAREQKRVIHSSRCRCVKTPAVPPLGGQDTRQFIQNAQIPRSLIKVQAES